MTPFGKRILFLRLRRGGPLHAAHPGRSHPGSSAPREATIHRLRDIQSTTRRLIVHLGNSAHVDPAIVATIAAIAAPIGLPGRRSSARGNATQPRGQSVNVSELVEELGDLCCDLEADLVYTADVLPAD